MGHGGYRQYLCKFKPDTSSDFPNCEGVPKEPGLVFFYGLRFVEEKGNLGEILEEVLVPENLMRRILAREEDWDAMNSVISSIHSKLRIAEETKKSWFRTPRKEER